MNTTADILVFLIFLGMLVIGSEVRGLKSRLASIEAKLDSVRTHFGLAQVVPSHSVPPEVRGLVEAGRKIEAIKLYRDRSGLSLKEAKDVIDRIESELRASRIIQP
jgi:hypothetical protein